ncbi:MAG TPA: hypothetical protein VF848_04225 [Steroidobacteraceae bacterium]
MPLSVMEQARASRLILAAPTTIEQAARHGKLLLGQWPHANPPNPEAYSLGVTATLRLYPLGIVKEILEPGIGLAASREYPPTQKAVKDWCDKRLAFHRGMIRMAAIATETAADVALDAAFTPEHRRTMLERLRALLAWTRGAPAA